MLACPRALEEVTGRTWARSLRTIPAAAPQAGRELGASTKPGMRSAPEGAEPSLSFVFLLLLLVCASPLEQKPGGSKKDDLQ